MEIYACPDWNFTPGQVIFYPWKQGKEYKIYDKDMHIYDIFMYQLPVFRMNFFEILH